MNKAVILIKTHKQIFRKGIVQASKFVFLFLLFSTAYSSVQEAWSEEAEKLIVDLDAAQVSIYERSDSKSHIFAFGGSFFRGFYPTNEWEIETLTPDQYRLRHKTWKNFFWKIDRVQKKVWRVNGADLKTQGNETMLLENIVVITPNDMSKKNWPPNVVPLNGTEIKRNFSENNIFKDLQKNDPGWGHSLLVSLKMASPQLILDPNNSSVQVLFEDAIISSKDDSEVRHVSVDVFQFRFANTRSLYWQINVKSMRLFEAWQGTFGFLNGRLSSLLEKVHLEDRKVSTPKNGIRGDLTMASYRGKSSQSAWLDSEKKLNEAILLKKTYDILIVPFQVNGYAIDRIDRSLMTRYLDQVIVSLTDYKTPSPTLVMRTLGEGARTYNDYDVFQLANKLDVKQIIRGYAGHSLNQRITITLLIQTRNAGEYFSSATKSEKYEWRDIVISDERTPAEAFESILHDVTARLFPQKSSPKMAKIVSEERTASLPSNIQMLSAGSQSPAIRAYYLQLLGMLHPEQSIAKEELFARSLMALRELAPQSPLFKVLKARALFYLYRRPAAIAALGSPNSAEERAFLAVLNGDLLSLREEIKNIRDPLAGLIAQIELSDLYWSYSPDQVDRESVAKTYPGWEKMLTRRLQHRDGWIVQSNLETKHELDSLFPIKGFTAQEILKSKIATGEFRENDDDIVFSVYNHYRRLMENQPEFLHAHESASVVQRDTLDLMVSVGESNLLKRIRLRRMQALNEDITALVDSYQMIYQGHPEMAHQKALALYSMAYAKQGQAQENLRKEAAQLQHDACHWSQGQTWIASQSCFSNNFYDADFPRRSYWKFSNDPKALADRKYAGSREHTQRGNLIITSFDRNELLNKELALLYTQTDFTRLADYHKKLKEIRMDEEAANLLEKNSQRFLGNSRRTYFYAKLAEDAGNLNQARALFEEAILLQPNDWSPYEGLSSLLIRTGDFKAASKTALKYPLLTAPQDGKTDQNTDIVALSNHAYSIGSDLWWTGSPVEAKPLFQLSAGYQTGSGSGMVSEASLALMENDYQKAASIYLKNAKRYNQPKNYFRYAELLHVMGFHHEAWSVFSQTQSRSNNNLAWSPVLIGHRMEGRTSAEELRWLNEQPAGVQASHDAYEFIFLVHALDRTPGTNLSSLLQAHKDSIEQSKQQHQSTGAQKMNQQNLEPDYSVALKKNLAQKFGEPAMPFSEGYAHLKKRHFSDAYAALKERFLDTWIRKDMFSYAIPYLAWSAAKSGASAEVEPYLVKYKNELNDDFDYYLAMAFLTGSKKEFNESIKNFKSARNHLLNTNGRRFMPAWYQLMESCEWLYNDTDSEGYRELLLEFSRAYQKIRPMDSWAYAFEAKYTRTAADRMRALGMTLYLDKQSDRISRFSNSEKKKAKKWLETNNPFLQQIPNIQKIET